MRKKIKTITKKILAGVMAAAMAVSMAGCGSSNGNASSNGSSSESNSSTAKSDLDKYKSKKIEAIQKAGKLVLATASGYPPYEFASVDNGGKIMGVDIALAQSIADGLGVQLEIQDMPFSETVTSLQTGNSDIVFAGTTETPERAKVVSFTNSYIDDKFVVIVMKKDKDKYKSLDDLAGKTIACELGSTCEQVAKEELKDSKFTSLQLNADTFTELQNGKVDAVVNSDVVAAQYAVANPDFTMLDLSFKSYAKHCQGCVAKNDEGFLKYVNDIIKENQDNGNFDKWVKQYSEQAAKEAK